MNKRRIEVFTAGCRVCIPLVDMVKAFADKENNDITVYDLVKQSETREVVSKVKEYGIKRLPAIAVNGQLLNCCKSDGITEKDLLDAGIFEKL